MTTHTSKHALMDLRLYLETPWPDPAASLHKPQRNEILMFFKHYDPAAETLRYVGHLFAPKAARMKDLFPNLRKMAGLPADAPLQVRARGARGWSQRSAGAPFPSRGWVGGCWAEGNLRALRVRLPVQGNHPSHFTHPILSPHPPPPHDPQCYEEIKWEPSVMVEPISSSSLLFSNAQLETGDIVAFQVADAAASSARFPTVKDFLSYVRNRLLVRRGGTGSRGLVRVLPQEAAAAREAGRRKEGASRSPATWGWAC
jgi:hypothetical protein